MSSYQTVKELLDAAVVKQKYPWHYTDLLGDGETIELRTNRWFTWYHPSGLVIVFPLALSAGGPVRIDTLPDGIKYLTYTNPAKQYVVITGQDGIVRYYLLPPYAEHNWNWSQAKRAKLGLVLMPHPTKLYVPVSKLPDYEIRINRKAKNAAVANWSDFFAYVDAMWDILPPMNKISPAVKAEVDRRWEVNQERPYPGDRDSWYVITQYARMNAYTKAWVRSMVTGKYVMEDDLPYDVKRVSELQPSITSHWDPDLILRLGKAGRLDDLPEI